MMKHVFAGAVAAGILWCTCTASISVSALPQNQTPMRDITTAQLVKDMGIGINLGNTYESCGDWIDKWGDGTPESYETAWGSPVITQQMIQGYADAGFDSAEPAARYPWASLPLPFPLGDESQQECCP